MRSGGGTVRVYAYASQIAARHPQINYRIANRAARLKNSKTELDSCLLEGLTGTQLLTSWEQERCEFHTPITIKTESATNRAYSKG